MRINQREEHVIGQGEKWISLFIMLAISGALLYKHFFMFLPPGPTSAYDQLCYKENAELLFHGKLFHHAQYPPFYSLILSPAFYFENWFNTIPAISYTPITI